MGKPRKLRIRCSDETYTDFYVFVAKKGFKTQEDAIIGLLELADKHLSKVRIRNV